MRMRAALAFIAASQVSSVAIAQQPVPNAPAFASPNLTQSGVRSMAASCAPCHGTGGRSAPGSSVAALAGRDDIAEKMKAFKEGRLEATLMHQIAKGFTDAEIVALAAYFAAQPR
jgi:sulfide dehydrogenase cytochrome subunit